MANVQPSATQTSQLARGPTMRRTTIVTIEIVSSRYWATFSALVEITAGI